MNPAAQTANNSFGDSYLPAISGDIFNQSSATQVFEKFLNPDFWQQGVLHIVLGSDCGLLIKHLLAKGIPNNSAYIFVEPSSFIDQVKTLCPPPAKWKGKIAVCEQRCWLETAQTLALGNYILNDRIELHPSVSALHQCHPDYAAIGNEIKKQLAEEIIATKALNYEDILIHATLENLFENYQPVSSIKNTFIGQTCIILGAGPSLDEHLDWIKANRDAFVIIAVSRLAQRLITETLTPDIIMSIDAQAVNFRLSKEMLSLPSDTLFIHANHVCPQLISQWHGKSLYIGERLPWQSESNSYNFEDKGGPTVTNTAVVIAAELGFSKILLSGVDLSSVKDKNTHAGSDDELEHINRRFEVTTNEGGVAQTNQQMLHAAKVLTEQVSTIKSAEIINLAATASKITGISHALPSQVTLANKQKMAWQDILPTSNLISLIDDNNKIVTELERALKDLKKIIKLSQDGCKFNRMIYKRSKQGVYNLKAKQKLDNIQLKLDTEFAYINTAIKKTGLELFNKTLKQGDMDTWTDKQLEQQGHDYYTAYIEGSRQLAQQVSNSISRVTARIEEDKPTPNFDIIFSQWHNDKQLGRAQLWLNKHSQNFSKQEKYIQNKLVELAEQFKQSIEHNPEEHIKLNHQRVYQEIETKFAAKEISSLEIIKQKLEQYKQLDARATELYFLASAYINILKGDQTEALESLLQTATVDRHEDLLNAMLSLSLDLKRLDISESALLSLTEQSHCYAPIYANILTHNQKFHQAIDVYTNYLQLAPEDLTTWVGLAKLYQQIQEPDLAKQVFSFVLENDPSNKDALAFMKL